MSFALPNHAARAGVPQKRGATRAPDRRPGRARSGLFRVLLLVAILAAVGLAAALLLPAGLALHPARQARSSDPARTYLVTEAVDRRQMQPVWTLVNLSGLTRICEKARAYTVVRQIDGAGAVPTRFIVYCRDQGFWVVQADAEADRYLTLGPVATVEEAEALLDQKGNFLWDARRPPQRTVRSTRDAGG